MRTAPALSVVSVGVHGAESIEAVLAALARQTIAGRIELVAVLPPGSSAPSPEGLCGSRVAELGAGDTTGEAIARGVRLAAAPVVAYVEEHSWPDRDWAEGLVAAHERINGAVGWTVENPNPETVTSWTHAILNFGQAAQPVESGERATLPWYHVAYRRDTLLEYGEELGDVLDAEWRVHAELRARGETLHLDGVRARHWNVSRPGRQLASAARGARAFGASRVAAGDWSAFRRAVYAAALPLILLLRLRTAVSDARRIRPPRPLRVGAMLSVNLAVSAASEVWGYIAGAGNSREAHAEVELERTAYLSTGDRSAWARELSKLTSAPHDASSAA